MSDWKSFNWANVWRLRRDEKDPPSFEQEPWLYAPAPSELVADGEIPGPGWQPDPLKEASQRWWDGDEWTSATRDLA
jgi:hypothetical protein